MISETPKLRRILFDRVPAEAFDRINWATIDRVTARLRDLGWTADDVASQILGDYGTGDPAALIVARAKNLDGPPPRSATPTPPPAQEVLATLHRAHEPSQHPSQWIAKLRDGSRA